MHLERTKDERWTATKSRICYIPLRRVWGLFEKYQHRQAFLVWLDALTMNQGGCQIHNQNQPEKCTFTMRKLIIFINKGQENEGEFTSVVACSSLICWTANSTLCFDNGGLNKAFSILSSNGSVTCKTFTENSRKQLSAKMFKICTCATAWFKKVA